MSRHPSLTAAMDTLEKDFLTCSLCLGVFQEPKILDCLHRFCVGCLQSWIAASYIHYVHGQLCFTCPVCRKSIGISDPTKPLSEWASMLKTDFYINSLISFAECTQAKNRLKVEQLCRSHPEKERDLYCIDCSIVVCYLCVAVSHRKCNEVLTLSTAAENRRHLFHLLKVQLRDALNILGIRQESRRRIVYTTYNLTKDKLHDPANILGIRKEPGRQLLINIHIASLRCTIHTIYTPGAILMWPTEKEEILRQQLKNGLDVRRTKMFSKVKQLKNRVKQVQGMFETLSSKVKTSSSWHLMCDDSVPEMIKECDNIPEIVCQYNKIQSELPKITKAQSYVGYGSSSYSSLSSLVMRNKSHTRTCKEVSTLPLPAAPKRDCVTAPQDRSEIHEPCTQGRSEIHEPCTQGRSEIHEPRHLMHTMNTSEEEGDSCCDLRDITVVTDWSTSSVQVFDARREPHARLRKPWSITQLTEKLTAVSLSQSEETCVVEISTVFKRKGKLVYGKCYLGLAADGVGVSSCVDFLNRNVKVLKSFADKHNGSLVCATSSYTSIPPNGWIQTSDEECIAVMLLYEANKKEFICKHEYIYHLHVTQGATADSSGRIILANSQSLIALTEYCQFGNLLIKSQKETILTLMYLCCANTVHFVLIK